MMAALEFNELSIFFSRDHWQKFSTLQTFPTEKTGFEPVQNWYPQKQPFKDIPQNRPEDLQLY